RIHPIFRTGQLSSWRNHAQTLGHRRSGAAIDSSQRAIRRAKAANAGEHRNAFARDVTRTQEEVMRRFLLLGICVAVLFSAQHAQAQNAYAGVWRSGNDPYYLWIGASWNDFEAKWKSLSSQNLRLVDIDIYRDGNALKFLGVWRGGNDAHYLW